MKFEIEKKFLVKNNSWKKNAKGNKICQGYACMNAFNLRIRIEDYQLAFLTIKEKSNEITRKEFEYPIPLTDAKELLEILCSEPYIEKTRYKIEFKGYLWEIDEFHGENRGLVLAEIELKHENELFLIPNWAGEEVSHDPRYYNSNLAKAPYSKWNTIKNK